MIALKFLLKFIYCIRLGKIVVTSASYAKNIPTP